MGGTGLIDTRPRAGVGTGAEDMDEGYPEFVAGRRAEILDRMGRALERAGRTLDEVRLVAVSKTVGVDEVVAAIGAGYRSFGENRPQELARKTDALALGAALPPVRFDMIGNLQKNKINAVLGRAALIHSIPSVHLAEAVSTRASKRIGEGGLEGPQPVLLEVNVSGEGSKSGFAPRDLLVATDELAELPGIDIQGLMTMAPRGDADVARDTFSGLRELRDVLRARTGWELPELSCGMSEDFEAALEEGSTIVRLGRVVFDPGFALQ